METGLPVHHADLVLGGFFFFGSSNKLLYAELNKPEISECQDISRVRGRLQLLFLATRRI